MKVQYQNSILKIEEFLGDLKTLVNLESPTRTKVLTDKAVEFFVGRFKELVGGDVEYFQQEDFGNHVKLTVGAGEKQVLLVGHIDTVWPVGESAKRPFTIKEERGYGPGIFDMKCGLLQGLYALSYVNKNHDLSKKLVFIVNTDEEVGSVTSRRIIEAEARKSEAVFVLEPSMGLKGALKTSRKGVGRFTLNVEGIPAHSGIDHEKGSSAIEELAYQIIKLQQLTDYEKGSTVNVGVISGRNAVNVISPSAKAMVDLRVRTMEEAARMEKLIKNLIPNRSDRMLRVEGGMVRPPFERKNSLKLYKQAEEIANELGIEISEASTGGGSDGCFTASLGIPTLDGLGAVGDGAHAYHEYVEINKIQERSALLAHLLIQNCR